MSRISLLDKYEVMIAVLTTDPYDFNLAKELVRSRAWGCLYRDDHSVVLVRSDSPRFREMLAKADFKDLWYPDEATRIRSEAFHSLLFHGEIRSALTQELKGIVSGRALPDLYGLIVIGLNGSETCLKPETRQYLISELVRLSGQSALHRNGATEVTGSLIAILGILEDNARRCGMPGEYSRIAAMKNSAEQAHAQT